MHLCSAVGTDGTNTGTLMHSYTKCIPHDAADGDDHIHVKVLMNVAHGQNMIFFRSGNPHTAKSMVGLGIPHQPKFYMFPGPGQIASKCSSFG